MYIRTAVAALAWASAATAAPLTFDQALDRARDTAPSLAGKALGTDAARSSARAAGALPDPKLEFGFTGFPVSGPNAGHPERDDFSTVRVGIEQDVPNRAKRTARTGRAEADVAASEAARLGEARTVRLGTALAWIDLYFAARKLMALDAVRAGVAPLIRTTPARLASGSARPAQTIEPAQMLAALDDRRAELVADAAKARAALTRWTGDTAAEVAGPPPSTGFDALALRAGLIGLPEVRVADAAAGQADADARLARAEKRPDWSWQVGYDRRDPRFGDMLGATIKIGLPLFAKNRQDPLILARDLDAQRARLDAQATARELVAAFETDLADHAMHHERLERARATLLPLAERRSALETASYSAGSSGLADALAARIAVAEARLELLTREGDFVRDAVRINLTYGSDAR